MRINKISYGMMSATWKKRRFPRPMSPPQKQIFGSYSMEKVSLWDLCNPGERLWNPDGAWDRRELLWEDRLTLWWQAHQLWPWPQARNSPTFLVDSPLSHLSAVLPLLPKDLGKVITVHATCNSPTGLGSNCYPWNSSMTLLPFCFTMVQRQFCLPRDQLSDPIKVWSETQWKTHPSGSW